MLTLAQTATYLHLQSTCFLQQLTKEACLVSINERTAEERNCNALQAVDKTTESYIKWILDLPRHMPLVEQRANANAIATLVCTKLKAITYQREQITRQSR